MTTYNYTFSLPTNPIIKFNAFISYINNYSTYKLTNLSMQDNNIIIISSSVEFDSTVQADLQTYISDYVDPEVWLTLDHIDNQYLTTTISNSSEPVIMQTFIISPESDGTVLDQMKTVVQCSTSDITMFQNWNSNVNPITIDLCLYNFSESNILKQYSYDQNHIGTSWSNAANNGTVGAASNWNIIQLYSILDVLPTSDCIWQIKSSISNSNVYHGFNSIQKLYYNKS